MSLDVIKASKKDKSIISNLLQIYLSDLCRWFRIDMDQDTGLYIYDDISKYFENKDNPIKKYPDRFPMQKIYDIHVEHLGTSKTENTLEGIMVYEQYKVYFLIMDNNGAFRPDLPVDKSYIPLIYDVITINGESKINRISQYLK